MVASLIFRHFQVENWGSTCSHLSSRQVSAISNPKNSTWDQSWPDSRRKRTYLQVKMVVSLFFLHFQVKNWGSTHSHLSSKQVSAISNPKNSTWSQSCPDSWRRKTYLQLKMVASLIFLHFQEVNWSSTCSQLSSRQVSAISNPKKLNVRWVLARFLKKEDLFTAKNGGEFHFSAFSRGKLRFNSFSSLI